MLTYAAPQALTDSGQIAAALASVLGFLVLLWQVVKRAIVSAVEPRFAEQKAASKAQHDEQNAILAQQNATLADHGGGIATVSSQVAELSGQLGTIEVRLNTGADRFADHDRRIEAVEQRTITTITHTDTITKDEPTT